MTTDLQRLVKPFPAKYVRSNPSGGGSYVSHELVEQRLLQVVGIPTTRLVEVIRGVVPAKAPNPNGSSARAKAGSPELPNAVVGVVLSMEAVVDGELVHVEEVGDCEDPHNWPHDGARMKDAFSDAYKRAAMRMGVALHVWAQQDFVIADVLARQAEEASDAAA